MFPLEKRRLQGDLITNFKYFKRTFKKDENIHFNKICCNRTRCNGFKLKEGTFRLDIRETFFTMRVVKHWHKLPRCGKYPVPGSIQILDGHGSE